MVPVVALGVKEIFGGSIEPRLPHERHHSLVKVHSVYAQNIYHLQYRYAATYPATIFTSCSIKQEDMYKPKLRSSSSGTSYVTNLQSTH